MMVQGLNTIILWAVNMLGLALWGYVLILAIESLGQGKRLFWNPLKDIKYWINWIFLLTALMVVLYRVDDIWMQKDMHYQWIRSIASIACPVGIVWHYRLKGVVSSVIIACADFWNGRD